MTEPQTLPDAQGHFGPYGGRFVPETLMAALDELAESYAAAPWYYGSYQDCGHRRWRM